MVCNELKRTGARIKGLFKGGLSEWLWQKWLGDWMTNICYFHSCFMQLKIPHDNIKTIQKIFVFSQNDKDTGLCMNCLLIEMGEMVCYTDRLVWDRPIQSFHLYHPFHHYHHHHSEAKTLSKTKQTLKILFQY